MNRLLLLFILIFLLFLRYFLLLKNINNVLINKNSVIGYVLQIFSNNKVLIFNSKIGYILINNCKQVDLYDKIIVNKLYKTFGFWKKQGIFLQSNSCIILKNNDFNVWYILKYFYYYKRRLFKTFNSYTTKSISGLLLAMLFGSVLFLEENTYNLFKNLSLMHVLVVSGYNIQLVLKRLSDILENKVIFSIRKLLMAFISYVFILGIGVSPPVVRASISSVLKNVFDIVGIKLNQISNLILTIFVILLWNIAWVFSLSFHLSILATLGVLGANFVTNKLNIKLKYLQDIIITFCVTLFTAPLLWLRLHVKVSWSGIIANIILLPYIEIVTFLGYTLFPLLFLSYGQVVYLFVLSNLLNILILLMHLVSSLF